MRQERKLPQGGKPEGGQRDLHALSLWSSDLLSSCSLLAKGPCRDPTLSVPSGTSFFPSSAS